MKDELANHVTCCFEDKDAEKINNSKDDNEYYFMEDLQEMNKNTYI